MYSLVIPVYKNEGSIPELIGVLEDMNRQLEGRLQVVFVVDGSPDRSAVLLHEKLAGAEFSSRLILLSRNFGAFPAVRVGLQEARGPYFAVMAADLQEPPELIVTFFRALESEPIDIAIGTREGRDDPAVSRLLSGLFWTVYRKFVQPEMPKGGVDVFACTAAVRDCLVDLDESNSTLVGLLFWVGYRRKLIGYQRRARRHGRSAWSFGRRLSYLMDSVFAFSDLPIRLLVLVGGLGLVFSAVFSAVVLIVRLSGLIPVPGYAGTVVVITFFAALNMFSLGIIGSYVWRAFENTKHRPRAIVMETHDFGKDSE